VTQVISYVPSKRQKTHLFLRTHFKRSQRKHLVGIDEDDEEVELWKRKGLMKTTTQLIFVKVSTMKN
jgi:hypothetical protein